MLLDERWPEESMVFTCEEREPVTSPAEEESRVAGRDNTPPLTADDERAPLDTSPR
jgi:hypothetical protein